jgi:hypothetical protein
MKSRYVALLVVMAVAAIVLTLAVRKSPEPSYRGRSLTDWLTEQDAWDGSTNAPVITAIQSMGADAVPILVEMSLAPTDSKLRQMVAQKVYSDPKLERFRFPIAPVRWGRANFALSVLGADGRAGLQPLIRGLTNQDPVIRARAAMALGHLGPVAEEAIPALIARQNDNEDTRGNVILALGMIGCQPDISRPVLSNALANTNVIVAQNAKVALSHFGRFKFGRPLP